MEIDRFVAGGVAISWLVSGVAAWALRRLAHRRLPAGCVVVAVQDDGGRAAPGPTAARAAIVASMTLNLAMVVLAMAAPLVGSGPGALRVIVPAWARVVGLAGYAIHLAWGVAVMYFNPTYTPCFRRMDARAVLATGGPYRWSRHPYYLGHLAAAPFVALLSATWPPLLGGLLLAALLPVQVAAEERFMASRFGQSWRHYAAGTRRWLGAARGATQDDQ